MSTISLETRPAGAPRPAHQERDADAAFPRRALAAAERRGAALGPHVLIGAVVGREDDDRVLGQAGLVELGEQLADMAVELGQAVAVDVLTAGARDAARRLLEVDEDVQAGRVDPEEEGLAVGRAGAEVVGRLREDVVVEGLHPFGRERPFVGDRAGSLAGHDAARIVLVAELRIGRAVGVLEILVGVQVIEIAEELVEAVVAGQMLVEVAEMVLAELRRGVALRL
jgi:hypothetical protein